MKPEERHCGPSSGIAGAHAIGRVLICVIAPLLFGCVYFSRRTLPGACTNDLGSPVRNFCVVRPGVLWRSEAPTRADAQWLVEHGVGTVVSLQLDVRRSFESVRIDHGRARFITYFRVGDFSAIQVLTHRHLDEHVAEVLAIIQKAPKPVLISCRAGVDRTGVVAAAYRMLVQGWSAKGPSPKWTDSTARGIRSTTTMCSAFRERERSGYCAAPPNGDRGCGRPDDSTAGPEAAAS